MRRLQALCLLVVMLGAVGCNENGVNQDGGSGGGAGGSAGGSGGRG